MGPTPPDKLLILPLRPFSCPRSPGTFVLFCPPFSKQGVATLIGFCCLRRPPVLGSPTSDFRQLYYPPPPMTCCTARGGPYLGSPTPRVAKCFVFVPPARGHLVGLTTPPSPRRNLAEQGHALLVHAGKGCFSYGIPDVQGPHIVVRARLAPLNGQAC